MAKYKLQMTVLQPRFSSMARCACGDRGWNAHFKLIEESKMIKLRNSCLNFDLQGSSGQTEDCPVILFLRLGAL